MTLETQIHAIETANINQETFQAMKRAGAAMKEIHGKLTPEKVDEEMYVVCLFLIQCSQADMLTHLRRSKLQEFNQLNEEISEAMSSVTVGPQLDDMELEAELEELQQKELEDKMLETGAVPVQKLPTVANGESESPFMLHVATA